MFGFVKIYFLFKIMHMYVSLWIRTQECRWLQKPDVLDLWELELQANVSRLTRVLETEFNPLQVHYMLLTAELPLQILVLLDFIFKKNNV